MTTYKDHYFVGVDGLGPMNEVTLEEWCRYENRAGFRSKSGPGTPGTYQLDLKRRLFGPF